MNQNETKQTKMSEANATTFKHPVYPQVFEAMKANIPVLLWGEAGTGKNVMAEQIAEELELGGFYFTNAIQEEYNLTGFADATGRYIETDFYKAWTSGGIFFLDEFDASDAGAVIWLNAALANKYATFPVHGIKHAHHNFRFIAGANSNGYEHNPKYKRKTLDGATLNRFLMIEVKWSEELEKMIYNKYLQDVATEPDARVRQANMTYLYECFKKARAYSIELEDTMIISTRTLNNMLKVAKESDASVLKAIDILEMTLFQGKIGIKDKYMKELKSIKLDMTVTADGTVRSVEATEWDPSMPFAKDILEAIMTEDDQKMRLDELISKVLGKEVSSNDSLLGKIKVEDLRSQAEGTMSAIWNDSGSDMSKSFISISANLAGKLIVSMKYGKHTVAHIQEGKSLLITYDNTKDQGIIFEVDSISSADSNLHTAIKLYGNNSEEGENK